MGIFARLFGAVSKQAHDGIRLSDANPWRVTPTRDHERFLRALPLLASDGAIVYFEGTGERHVAEHLRTLSIPAPVQVAVGTIWPTPDVYHVPLSETTMENLAVFLDRGPTGYLCTHCHVYRDRTVLLEWHDAFGRYPMYVSRTVDKEIVARFAQALGSSYMSGFTA